MAVLEAADQLAPKRERRRRSCTECWSAFCAHRRATRSAGRAGVLPCRRRLRPQLDTCVRCGGGEPDVTLVAFDLTAEGGVLCRRAGRAR
jgi:hypothetical protein